MINKNGFTLIELLAVIIVLAVIALIATPIILGIITDTKKEAFKDTAYGIIDSAKFLYTQSIVSEASDKYVFITYESGSETSNIDGINLNYEGMKPQSGKISIRQDGKIGINIYNGEWCASKSFDANEVTVSAITESECINIFNVVYNFTYTGNVQTYTVPQAGIYQIELWGAQGGSWETYNGAKGAYASGYISLSKDTQLFLYIGSSGATVCNPYTSCPDPVFNGGAQGGYFTMSGYQLRDGSGGGATDVRLTNGTWSDTTSLKSRIMVAGAGGGGTGGYGGALVGGNGTNPPVSGSGGSGGSQTAGGNSGRYAGTFGLGGMGYVSVPSDANNNDGYGGGGGYYGGGGGYGGIATVTPSGSVGPGGGGSSFISGHTGCNAINSSGTSTGQPNHYSGYIFTNTVMTAGNAPMPNPSGGNETGHTGNGYARITYLG